MATKKRASIDTSRLTVLAAGDEAPFEALLRELLESGDRLGREAALEALVERPLAALRPALRDLYFSLDENGTKLDQGARQRIAIVRILTTIHDGRDTDIAVRASETVEKPMGEDVTWGLRVHGLRMLAELAPELFPFIAVEHLDDVNLLANEPAETALQLLAATGQHAAIYEWLISSEPSGAMIAAAIELLDEAPPVIVERLVRRTVESALKRQDEPLCIALAEAIVERELAASYDVLVQMIAAKVSDELYQYIAMLLAGTNRSALLAILEHELHRGRRPNIVLEALRVRTTPEQDAILRRWEDGEESPAGR